MLVIVVESSFDLKNIGNGTSKLVRHACIYILERNSFFSNYIGLYLGKHNQTPYDTGGYDGMGILVFIIE